MLVLSRRVGERIVINENIVVTVVRIDGGRVRLGIEAPPEVSIIRQELAQAMEASKVAKVPAGEIAPTCAPLPPANSCPLS